MSIIQTLVAVAKAEIGVREIGRTNSSPRVKEYQAATTLGGTGWPWCAALIAWLFLQLSKKTGIKIPWPNSASCDVTLAWARSEGILHDEPKVGDAFLVMASRYDATHIGLVIEVQGARFKTAEGNSNDEGSREGYEVASNWRINSDRYKFVRPLDLVKVPEVPAVKPYTLQVLGKPVESRTVGNTVYAQAQGYGAALGQAVGWNASHQTVLMGGREVPVQAREFDGRNYVPVRALAALDGLRVGVNAAARTVEVTR